MFALECRCARHIFRQWQKECSHGNGILWQKWGKNLASLNYCPQFFTNSDVMRHRCLPWGVDLHDTLLLTVIESVLPLVTAYYGNNGNDFASRTTSSVFHQFSWNLAQMFALGCRCARYIFWQWPQVPCHYNAAYLWQKWGENLASRATSSVFHQSAHEKGYGTEDCLGV